MNLKITKITNSIGRKLGINKVVLYRQAKAALRQAESSQDMARFNTGCMIRGADEYNKSILKTHDNYFEEMILHLKEAIARMTAAEGCRTVSGAQKKAGRFSLLEMTVFDRDYKTGMHESAKRFEKEMEKIIE